MTHTALLTIRDLLSSTRACLQAAGIPDAALEAEVLVMHAAALSRAQLYARLGEALPVETVERLEALIARRVAREPLAYVTGHREFFGLDLLTDRRALVPRQETETLVEETIAVAQRRFGHLPHPRPSATPSPLAERETESEVALLGRCTIADVGTGSGAIAIALAMHLPRARIVATDASREALALARDNAARSGVADRVEMLEGDLLSSVRERVDIVVANLPYVPESEWASLQPEIRLFEPKAALVPGATGLEAVRRLLSEVASREPRPVAVLLELGIGQAQVVAAEPLGLFVGATVRTYRDLAGIERGVIIEAS
ncbi:MAG: peptide chain release factor N(5)-glutamine methyltransferase [Chloroflexi bacterium]|nr:peptide chain release factor N(5)-glutamine methyltransferase [Chloroflexota bacterium]